MPSPPYCFALLFLCLAFFSSLVASQCALTTGTISNSTASLNGLSLTFDKAYTMGQYANGDWWILGPVTLISTSPAWDGQLNGFEVNPDSKLQCGFDYRLTTFNASRVPTLPLVVPPNSSIVKTESLAPYNNTACRPCLNKAIVFTIVGSVPPNNGNDLLRPNYFGALKSSYRLSDIDLTALPGLTFSPALPNAPNLSWVTDQYGPERLKLDHRENYVADYWHPAYNMPNYGAAIANINNLALLRLMYADVRTDPLGLCAVARFLQVGIDHLAAMRQGSLCFPSNGGHDLGRKLPIIFASVVLKDSAAQDFVFSKAGHPGNCFHEDLQTTNTSLYGEQGSESQYWQNKKDDSGLRTNMDPYGYIDGGFYPGGGYQYCCNSKNWKAEAIVLNLVPRFRQIWNWEPFMDYVARWVHFGAWAQPDPCAPVIGICSGGTENGKPCTSATAACYNGKGSCKTNQSDPNYGKLYGPDGKGGCILDTDPSDGIGRNPWAHGTNMDGGLYTDPFFDQMYNYFFNASYMVNESSVLGNNPPSPAGNPASVPSVLPTLTPSTATNYPPSLSSTLPPTATSFPPSASSTPPPTATSTVPSTSTPTSSLQPSPTSLAPGLQLSLLIGLICIIRVFP